MKRTKLTKLLRNNNENENYAQIDNTLYCSIIRSLYSGKEYLREIQEMVKLLLSYADNTVNK